MATGEILLFRDPHRYVAHPHMAQLADGSWLVVATCGPRRPVTLHPPIDPEFVNILLRSTDEGATWSAPVPAPGYGATGAECAGLTVLPDGTVLLNQWRFRWYPDDAAPADEPLLQRAPALSAYLGASTELDGAAPTGLINWARGGGDTTVHRSEDGGRRWVAANLDTAPYTGGYGLRGGLVLPSGAVLLPLSDVPHYARVFVCRSEDGGRSWSTPIPAASLPRHEFEEPAPALLPDGSVVLLLRENVSRLLHIVRSDDEGRTWSAPEPTSIDAYPAHLLVLSDGRLAAVTARRRPSGAILIFLSDDCGHSWDLDRPVVVAEGIATSDLGYPTAVPMRDGRLFVAYYRRDSAGVTGLWGRAAAA